MKEWMRHLPHPSYGNWCGRKNTHDEYRKPIDELDECCYCHDMMLRASENETEKQSSDLELYNKVKLLSPKHLSLKGCLYRLGILLFFKPKKQ